MFKGKTLEEFNAFFTSETVCKRYLFDLKWKEKYSCRKCGFDKYWKGRSPFHARCARCDYDESVTAQTVFHKIQIPLLKVFSIAFHISVLKKGISTNDMADVYGINQKTAWRLQRKVQESMGAALFDDLTDTTTGCYTLDSITISHRGGHLNGLQRVNLSVIKKKLQKGKVFQICCIASMPMPGEFANCRLSAGHYVDERKNIQMWNFKAWLTGTHHHCSEKYLQGYVDEYYFKLSYRQQKEMICHTLIKQMVKCKPLNFSTRAA